MARSHGGCRHPGVMVHDSMLHRGWIAAFCSSCVSLLLVSSSSCGGGGTAVPGDVDAGEPDGGAAIALDAGMRDPLAQPRVPGWARTARVGGLYLQSTMTDEEIDGLLRERLAEHVSVIEIDTRLSYYLTEEELDAEVAFLDRVARKTHALGMRAVVYYPSLEVITLDGKHAARSMFKDHPEWVQRGIDGKPNVFYGREEFWVAPDAESAWMSPNSSYRAYYLQRIRKLAATALDGIWLDGNIYLETGAAWAGTEVDARIAFRQWSRARGLGGVNGLTTPGNVDSTDAAFRAWIRWRHENLADFVEDVRRAALAINPDLVVIVESAALDHMDATTVGLDGTLRRSATNFLRVWEVGTVSSELGMQWASIEDFTSKIAIHKWAAACEGENIPWSFVYGREPLDAGLSMAVALATGNAPFEARTPDMFVSVGAAFRARWFGFVRDHEHALLTLRRMPSVGIWYSAATRDYQDYPLHDGYGLYITTEPPNDDPAWWSTGKGDSAMANPHLGGWRGAAHVLTQLHVPFAAIVDRLEEPGAMAAALRDVPLLWMPSVGAISDDAAHVIREYVRQGGTVLATGTVPGMLDELGNRRSRSVLADVFDLAAGSGAGERSLGQGVAIYRPDLQGRDAFALAGDAGRAARVVAAIDDIVRARVPARIRLRDDAPAYVDISRLDGDRQYLYIVNLAGVQQPIVSAPVDLAIEYRPPPGMRVVTAYVATPDEHGQAGAARVTRQQDGLYRIDVGVDQLALIEVALAPGDDLGTRAAATGVSGR